MALATHISCQPSCSNMASETTSDTKALVRMPYKAPRGGYARRRREGLMARSNLLAFAEATVDALLHAGRPEGDRHHADQQALRHQVEAERKAQEADFVELLGEGHHGGHCGKNDDQRGNGKRERIPAVTSAWGLFRHRSSPSRSTWPPSS